MHEQVPKGSMFYRAWHEIQNMDVHFENVLIEDVLVQDGVLCYKNTKEVLDVDVIFPFYYPEDESLFEPFLNAIQKMGLKTCRSGISDARDKCKSISYFKKENITHPKSIPLFEKEDINQALSKIKLPCVFKPAIGRQGEGVVLIEKEEDVEKHFLFYKDKGGSLLQELITPMGHHIRAFVIGDKVFAAMLRQAPKGELVANHHHHETLHQVALSTDEEIMAVRATKIFNLPYSGVDLMRSENGKTCVLEVNTRPGLSIEQGIQVNVAKAWLEYFLQ